MGHNNCPELPFEQVDSYSNVLSDCLSPDSAALDRSEPVRHVEPLAPDMRASVHKPADKPVDRLAVLRWKNCHNIPDHNNEPERPPQPTAEPNSESKRK